MSPLIRHRYSAAAGVVANLVGGAALFLVFRLAIELVGASVIGTWALIQSAFFLSRLNDSGTGLNLTRMVAVSRAETGSIPLFDMFCAGIVLSVLPVFLLGLALVAPISWLMVHYFDSALPHETVLTLVLLSFGTALVTSLSSLLLAILEGAGALFHRQIITIAGNAALGALAYPLLAGYGAEGLGLIYLAAAAVPLLGAAVVLPFSVSRSRRDSQYRKSIIAVLWRENLKISGMALVRLTFEPWTKFLVATTAGLSVVAALDLALRVTTLTRVALQSATQPLLTMGARSPDSTTDHFLPQYARAHLIVVRVNIYLACIMAAAGPLVAFLGFGAIPHEFLAFYVLLVVANSVNSVGIVGYYFDVSAGRVDRILQIHLAMMGINLIAGAFLGFAFGGVAAVAAYTVSFIYGGIALAKPWMKASGSRWRQLLWDERASLTLACLVIGTVVSATFLSTSAGSSTIARGWTLAGASAAASAGLLGLFAITNWRLFR